MKVNATLGDGASSALEKRQRRLGDVPARVRVLEEAGVDCVTSAEVDHDPFLPLALAAEHSSRVELMTGIAVAFARTPMALAHVAHDLNSYAQGRFILGLGSQVKAHIERRYDMPWSKPAARMKEYISALHAVWDNWYDGKPLDFRGDFYTHTLMTPRFVPGDLDYGRPRIAVAAVGPLMTRAAAEVGDLLLCHAFTTRRYMEQVTVPMIDQALSDNGRSRKDFEICYPPFLAILRKEEELAEARHSLRGQIAFYASTPAYRGVLDVHGWGDVQTELNRMAKADRWADMNDVIDDTMLDEFAIYGDVRTVAEKLRSYEGLIDRISINADDLSADEVAALMAGLR